MRETDRKRFVRRRNGITRAEVLAIAAVAAVLMAMLAPLLAPRSKISGDAANLALCKENLRQIGIGLLAYAQDNGGVLPVSDTVENPHTALLQAAATRKYVGDPKLFYCPAQPSPSLSYSDANFKAGIIGYFYYSAAQASDDEDLSRFLLTGISWPRELNTHLDGRSWVMSDIWVSGAPTAHSGYRKGVNYLMLDGSVGFVSESPRQAFH